MRNPRVRARILLAALLSLALVTGATATVVAESGGAALYRAPASVGPDDLAGMPWPK